VIRRTTVLCLEIVLALVLGVVVAGSVLAWRLSKGPIVIDGARPYVERMLSDPTTGLSSRVGETAIVWSIWNKAFDLVARDVTVREVDGPIRAQVATVSVGLSTRALLSGQLAPKRIDVIRPRVTVIRALDGGWRLLPETATEATASETDLDLNGILRRLSNPIDDRTPLAFLRIVQVREASVTLVDAAGRFAISLDRVTASLERTPDGLSFSVDGRADWGDAAPNPFKVSGRYRLEEGRVTLDAQLNKLPLDRLAEVDTALAPLAGVAVPVDLRLKGEIGLVGQRPLGSARLVIGAGEVLIPELYPKPRTVRGGAIGIEITDDLNEIAVDASLDVEGVVLAANATLTRDRSGYAMTVDVATAGVPIDALERYWPPDIAPPAREWVTDNLEGGSASAATLRAVGWLDPRDVGTLRIDSLDGRIDFSGIETHYFRPLPPVVDTVGSAVFDAETFNIDIASGHLRSIDVLPSRVTIRGLGAAQDEVADVELAIRGPLAEALRVLDSEPLGYPRKLGIDVDRVVGRAGARLRFEIPLLRDLDVDDIKVAAAANLAGVTFPGAVAGKDLTDATLSLDLTGAGMTLEGTGQVLGELAEVRLDQRFHDQAGYTSRAGISTRLTAADLAELGLDATGLMDGRLAMMAHVETSLDGSARTEIEADLQDTGLTLKPLGWHKPPGSAGVLRLTLLEPAAGPPSIQGLDLKTADLVVAGTVTLDRDGRFLLADLSRLRLGRTDAAGRVERGTDGVWRAALDGTVIDLSPILDREDQDDRPDGLVLDVRVSAGILHLSDTATLSGAALAVKQTGPRLSSMTLTGGLGAGEMSLTVQPVEGARWLSLQAADAGAVLTAFGIIDTIRGGRLRADGWVLGDDLADSLDIAARIDEFRLVDAPIFAQVLSVASITGLQDAIAGDGIRFARARADILTKGKKVTVRNGLAYGPGLGLKVEGVIDDDAGTIDVGGLLAPAYSLSRLIDRIPVLGELITGGEGEGLLATGFQVTGTRDKPQITVNPLTALAPGFVRDLLSAAARSADAPEGTPPASGTGPSPPEDQGL